jgi:hypothetical protein
VQSNPLHFFKFPKNILNLQTYAITKQIDNHANKLSYPTLNNQPIMADPPRPKSRINSTVDSPRPKSRTTRNSQATDHGQGISATSTADARHVAEILTQDPEPYKSQGQQRGKEALIKNEGRAGQLSSRAASIHNATTTTQKPTTEEQSSLQHGVLAEAIEAQRQLRDPKGKGRETAEEAKGRGQETAEAYSHIMTERSSTYNESWYHDASRLASQDDVDSHPHVTSHTRAAIESASNRHLDAITEEVSAQQKREAEMNNTITELFKYIKEMNQGVRRLKERCEEEDIRISDMEDEFSYVYQRLAQMVHEFNLNIVPPTKGNYLPEKLWQLEPVVEQVVEYEEDPLAHKQEEVNEGDMADEKREYGSKVAGAQAPQYTRGKPQLQRLREAGLAPETLEVQEEHTSRGDPSQRNTQYNQNGRNNQH